jgi:glycosyltransferase involved in cell wall biosynthesis
VIHRPGKQGLGTAYKAGFVYGLARGYHYLCTMDADFSHSPEALPALLEQAGRGYDLVVGSRYVAGGQVVGSTWSRRFVSYSANWLAHSILGVTVRDCTAGFRCYRRRALETINLNAIFSSGYSFLIEMAFHCQQAGLRIRELPIIFVNRTEGVSKISKKEVYKAVYTLLRLRTSVLPWERIMGVYQRRRARNSSAHEG